MHDLNVNHRLKINGFFGIYLSFMLVVLINDYIIYLFDIQNTFLSYIIATIFLCIIYFLFRNKVSITFPKLSTYDWIAIFFLIIIFLLRSLVPDDDDFDTLNYHIFLQENWYKDNVFTSFFPGRNFNTFLYPLGDRMFFVFRSLLGYRLGVSLNLVVVALLYFQVKSLLSFLIGDRIKLKEYLKSLFSVLVIFNAALFYIYWSYWTDLLVLPIYLELVRLLLKKNSTGESIVYFCLLNGLIIAQKVVNLPIVSVFMLFYLFRERKTIKLNPLLIGLSLFFVPFLIYSLNAYLQTGNPVFPFYNGIFKSPYFPPENWLDRRWGPNGLFETLIWPFYILFVPERVFEYPVYPRMPLGYIVSIVWFIILAIQYLKHRKHNRTLFTLLLITLLISVMWGKFMMGYIRYGGLLLEITYGIIVVVAIIFLFNIEAYRKPAFVLSSILCLVTGASIFFTSYNIFGTDREAGFRLPIYLRYGRHKMNARYLIRDRNTGIDETWFDKVGLWLDFNNDPADPTILRKDIPIASVNAVSNEKTRMMLEELIRKYSETGNLYTYASSFFIEDTINQLNDYGLMLDGRIFKIKPFYRDRWKSLYILKLKELENGKADSFIRLNLDNLSYSIELPNSCQGKIHYYSFGGLHPIAEPWGSDGFRLDFYVENASSIKMVHSTAIKPTAQFYEIDFTFDVPIFDPEATLVITFSNPRKKHSTGDLVGLINPTVECGTGY